MRILVVEDDRNTACAVEQFLRSLGHRVELAENEAGAIEMADRMYPEMLICDWKLAGNDDGVEVAGRVRSRHDIPVIMVTGRDLAKLKHTARASEVKIAAFRRKPVHLPELADLIESLGVTSRR